MASVDKGAEVRDVRCTPETPFTCEGARSVSDSQMKWRVSLITSETIRPKDVALVWPVKEYPRGDGARLARAGLSTARAVHYTAAFQRGQYCIHRALGQYVAVRSSRVYMS